MKKLATIIVGVLFITNIGTAQNTDKVMQLAEPVETGENYKVYGSEFPDDAQFFAPGYLVRNADIFKAKKVATQGTIKQVCQKKGCFFMLSAGEKNIRVSFKDYKFFIPTDAAGSKVQLMGIFRVKDISEDQAKHYAEDAGGDAKKVMGPQKEYNIVASSVKIIDAKDS
ncbi:DUF4920 domain-containing protein [Fodinibius sp.]|uniref:DUF4920 domain-containing protein n=1 Tax=Fodinibius sp. TaxID=1872440 RepID=UPI002ACDF607|nr:DUF4920 domain-containing protein [Fodinibius sp.]MDZ7660409.1 DUF4920 domain-containing protein [Fodinibius sp.]